MATSPFINLYRTLDEALMFKDSPINSQYIYTGVQLKPFNTEKYIQITDTPDGIDLEDWSVFVVDLCTGVKTNITSYFLVESLTNSTNGNPQLYWSLLNVPYDFGWSLVYLEVTQLLGETFYSSAFMFTEIDSELTSQLHYKDKKAGVYQSISLRTWFNERDKKTELSTYWQVSTKNTVSTAVKSKKIELFRTELMPRDTIILLTDVLENPILYLNTVRYSLFEAIDIPKKQGQENYTSVEYTLSPNYSENFFALPDYNGIDYGEPDYNT